MRMISTAPLVLSLVVAAGAGAAEARTKPGLANEADINAGLLTVGIADEIRKKCDSINGRVLKGLFYLNRLERMARERGYSQAEIDAYIDNDAEEDKLRRKGEAYMAARGVDFDNPETYCDLGRAEIASDSPIGAFLRAK